MAVGLLLLSLLASGRLWTPGFFPASPVSDLGKHAAMILNFRDAFVSGQWLPRLQPGPLDCPDIPTFQYYGTMLGYFALPWLSLGVGPLGALVPAVVCARFVGVICLYLTARRLGGSPASGGLAAVSYLMTPYVVSCLYGRVAMPESIALGLLPVLTLGLAFLATARPRAGFYCIAIGIVALSLSHPIFLLYSVGFMLVLSVLALPLRQAAVATLAIVAGVALSAFQWGPAFVSRGDLRLDFFGGSPYGAAYLTSLSGLGGLAQPLATNGIGAGYYFTLGWWTLPLCGMTLWRLRGSARPRRLMIALLITLAGALFAATSPVDFWQYLPGLTWSVQFPYRLLSYCALVTALLVPLAWPTPGRWATVLTLSAVVVTQAHVWLAPVFVPSSIPSKREALISGYSLRDYAIEKTGPQRIMESDDWLMDDNLVIVPTSPPMRQPALRLEGVPASSSPTKVWLAEPVAPFSAVTAPIDLPAGPFAISIPIPRSHQRFTVRASTYVVPHEVDPRSADKRRLSLRMTQLMVYDAAGGGQPLRLIRPADVTRDPPWGYARVYRINWYVLDTAPKGDVLVELPLAYSRFTHVTQQGRVLPSVSTPVGRVLVKTNDPLPPFHAAYRIPLPFVVGPLATVVLLAGHAMWERARRTRREATPPR